MSLDKGIEYGKEWRRREPHMCCKGEPESFLSCWYHNYQRAAPIIDEEDTRGARIHARAFRLCRGMRLSEWRSRRRGRW